MKNDHALNSEIELLLHHMPSVVRRTKNGWAKDFAKSIVKQSRRRGWMPSPKQLPLMRSLVSDLFSQSCNEGADFQVIE